MRRLALFALIPLVAGCVDSGPFGMLGPVPNERIPVPAPVERAESRSYRFVIGTAFLAGLSGSCDPVTAASSRNGDRIAISGRGTFTTPPGRASVSGGGAFSHATARGRLVRDGTWEATELISFHGYGVGAAQGTPPTWEGGVALIRVRLSTGAEGVLRVECLLGEPPEGAVEGIGLDLDRAARFDLEAGGCTLFIRR